MARLAGAVSALEKPVREQNALEVTHDYKCAIGSSSSLSCVHGMRLGLHPHLQAPLPQHPPSRFTAPMSAAAAVLSMHKAVAPMCC